MVKAILVRGFPQPASPLRGWGRWGQGRAHLEPQGQLAPLRALLLGSPARKERLLEGGRAQAGVMDIAGWGAAGAAWEPPAEEFCSEPAAGEAFPALPRELLGTTHPAAGAACGRDPEPPPGSGPACKGVLEFYSQLWVFTPDAPSQPCWCCRDRLGGSGHASSPQAGPPPQGAGRGSPCPQALGLPQELSPPARAASC